MIRILPIDTKDQLADIFTKPLGQELFNKFREGIQKWSKDVNVAVKHEGTSN